MAKVSEIVARFRDYSPSNSFQYERRKPELSVLHTVIRENLETFLAQAEQNDSGRGFPAFIENELRRYLDCGFLSQGFARFRCSDCGAEKLVAFDCTSYCTSFAH